VRGPLHGIPIVLKDNFDTADMPTTAGALAIAGCIPPDDAFQVRRLREAGAVILGKTNLHEFARGIETVSSLGGYTRNPYDPRRNPGGSSGGTAAAVAAGLAAVGMGSDTCGSIRIPAANNNLFGLRVTQGLSSRDGIIPLSHTQDVGGPLARTMIDLVTVLDATIGEDPADAQTAGAVLHVPATYRAFLEADALRGVRLGVLTAYLETDPPYGDVSRVVRGAVAAMADAGAEVVELDIDGLDELLRDSSVIDYEFTTDVEAYLRDADAPVRSIAGLLDTGGYHEALDGRYRRSIARAADNEEHRARLARRTELRQRLVEAMNARELDALVYPSLRVKPQFIGEPQYGSLCRLSAHSGLPAISVPAGFTPDGVPVGVELLARPFEEGHLIALAYAWEQVASPRRPPPRTPSLVSDTLTREFVVRGPSVTGRLFLERPTQVLRYELEVDGVARTDIRSITLHRGRAGTPGPVIERLGVDLQGVLEVRNEHLGALLHDGLYLDIDAGDASPGDLRGQIERR